jgi:hypothetical protein
MISPADFTDGADFFILKAFVKNVVRCLGNDKWIDAVIYLIFQLISQIYEDFLLMRIILKEH